MTNIKSNQYIIDISPLGLRPIAQVTCVMPARLVRAFFEGKLEELLQEIAEENEKWLTSRRLNTSLKMSSKDS